jgi:hypothetical protein
VFLRSLRTLLRATDSRKESRCLSCYPIQLSKNRLPSKGRTCCQTPSSVSSGNSPLASRRANRFRLTRTLRPTLAAWDGKIGTAGTAGPKSLGPPEHVVNLSLSPEFSTTDARLPLFRPPRSGSVKDPFAAGTVENRRSLSTIPTRCCTNPCACEPYGKRPQHRFPDCADGRGQPTSRYGYSTALVLPKLLCTNALKPL